MENITLNGQPLTEELVEQLLESEMESDYLNYLDSVEQEN